jgi:hypothetical protein
MSLNCEGWAKFPWIYRVVEVNDHLPQFVRGIGWRAFRAVVGVEPLETFVSEVA